MSKEWSASTGAKMIKNHQGKKRPAWLWDANGLELIWRNDAARLFSAQYKKHKAPKHRLRLAKDAVPIKGQVRRLLRLGSMGLTGLARVRFLVGSKPVSTTCSCTPIELADGKSGLLIVGVDKIKGKLFKHLPQPDPNPGSLNKPKLEPQEQVPLPSVHTPENPLTPEYQQKGTLSQLMDKLDAGSGLYDPLNEDEGFDTNKLEHGTSPTQETFDPSGTDFISAHPNSSTVQHDVAQDEDEAGSSYQWRVIGRGFTRAAPLPDAESGTPIRAAADTNADAAAARGADNSASMTGDIEGQQPGVPTETGQLPAEEVERVAKYNFEELAKILKDKTSSSTDANLADNQQERRGIGSGRREADDITSDNMINLSEEILVLNRLPVGILIFRDQNILFANKAMAELIGSPSISDLKANGLDVIFPKADTNTGLVVPAINVVDADGQEVPVETRLQSINWQNSPALMLWAQHSFSSVETDTNARSFVNDLAEARHQGYFETDRNGVVVAISERGAELLKASRLEFLGHPLTNYTHPDDHGKFVNFLEGNENQPQDQLPFVHIRALVEPLTFEIFTRGEAGIITGYFGSIEEQDEISIAPNATKSEIATLVLARLSRGIRRPLNTVLGFSGLIRSEAFGEIQNKRYVDYARNIENAGGEIAQLADEMDEYARLEDKDYAPDNASFDMAHLLDECMGLVRNQANRAQVLVRSAIPENLPFVMADRSSLRQAILNLLANAIAQTPVGQKVILSAQIEDDGSVGVHVRDSSNGPSGIDDRFIIFREQDKRGGEAMVAMPSSMGLTLTRSLIAVNACTLHVDPSTGTGTLMSLIIPEELLTASS